METWNITRTILPAELLRRIFPRLIRENYLRIGNSCALGIATQATR